MKETQTNLSLLFYSLFFVKGKRCKYSVTTIYQLTCHTGSLCHPAEVTFKHLPPSPSPNQLKPYLIPEDARKAEST